MGEFCEFEIDFEQFDDLRAVVVHDECGAHEDVWFYRFDGLKAENAKLRELVQDIYKVMWACAEQRCTHRHDGCFRVHGNNGDICISERCWYEDRMSELGIEV